MRRARAGIACLVFGLFLAGCGAGQEHESFAPLERAEGETLEGYTEALYDLSGGEGRFGEVKVWSRGAYTAPEIVGTVIHVGFDIDNHGVEPLTLAPEEIRLESVQTKEQVLRDIGVHAPTSVGTILPDSTGRIELEFVLPESFRPSDVYAFRVAWSVQSDGFSFKEFTPFARTEKEAFYVPVHAYYYPYYSYHYPYYDPFWGPSSRLVIIRRHYPRRVIVRGHRHLPRPRRRPIPRRR